MKLGQFIQQNAYGAKEETISVIVPQFDEDKRISFIEKDMTYIVFTIPNNRKIKKFGYNCDLNYMIYPFFVNINNIDTAILPDKNGVYDSVMGDLNTITTVKCPKDANFTFDYYWD